LVRVAHRDLKGARLCAGRADLYSARSRLSRLARFAKMVSSGVYGGLDGALSGMRSAFKDLMVALAGPGALHLLEKVRRLPPKAIGRSSQLVRSHSRPNH
jgi:hypothetical protein